MDYNYGSVYIYYIKILLWLFFRARYQEYLPFECPSKNIDNFGTLARSVFGQHLYISRVGECGYFKSELSKRIDQSLPVC